VLGGANIDSLRVVTEPVAKVDTLDINLAELGTLGVCVGADKGEKSVFNVSMAEVDSFDVGD
jgi:hypothetical protein